MTAPLDGDAFPASFYSAIGPYANAICRRKNVLNEIVMGIEEDADDGTYFLINPKQFNTNNQSMQVTLAANQSPLAGANDEDSDLCTTVHLHCNSTGTEGSYARIFDDRVEFGTFTYGIRLADAKLPLTIPYTFATETGFSYTKVDTHVPPEPITASTRVEFRNNGTMFFLSINDSVRHVVTLSPTMDASHRWSMVSINRKTFLSGTLPATFPMELGSEEKQDGFWVSLIVTSDYIPQAYLGSGAKITRVTGTAVNAAGGVAIGGAPFPTYYDTVVRNTTDIGVDLATSKFTVSVEGWYEVKMCQVLTGAITGSNTVVALLLKNGTAYEWGDQLTGPKIVSCSWTVYLGVGDYVQPGYALSTSITGMFGAGQASIVGLYNFFNITLANRGIGPD